MKSWKLNFRSAKQVIGKSTGNWRASDFRELETDPPQNQDKAWVNTMKQEDLCEDGPTQTNEALEKTNNNPPVWREVTHTAATNWFS
jgi:hypothetical protein